MTSITRLDAYLAIMRKVGEVRNFWPQVEVENLARYIVTGLPSFDAEMWAMSLKERGLVDVTDIVSSIPCPNLEA